jgi:hypothetical protein
MDTNQRNKQDQEPTSETTIHRSAGQNADLPDSPHDAERLKAEETTIDLPEVKDIPGQEFVHTAPLGMLADTTISSADEEGEGLFNDDTSANADDEVIPGVEGDTTKGSS